MKKLFTSESVCMGHPDKACDQIADHILDAYLSGDENSRVACEVCVDSKRVIVMGEVTSKAKPDVEKIVRDTLIKIGYENDIFGFNGHTIPVEIFLNKQSPDISRGVNQEKTGAGDQGMMFGYASSETKNYMPLVHVLACSLTKRMDEVRKKKIIKDVGPDGKAQITLEYNDEKVRVQTIIISIQHQEKKDLNELKREIKKEIIDVVIPSDLIDKNTQIYINPTGRFVIGGPVGDTGLTGRKIIVDTYGGIAHHGGGAFSGKDYTKVDRSAAYYARYVAKNVVASGLAKECEVSVCYGIGLTDAIAIDIDTFNTNKIPEQQILERVKQYFDFSPANITQELNLKNVEYADTTMYSHFGKENLPWERLDKIEFLRNEENV